MSREKSEKGVRNVPITVRLNEEEHEKLKQCAAACGLSAAEFMRQLCKENAHSQSQKPSFGNCWTNSMRCMTLSKSVFLTIQPPLKSVRRLRILSRTATENNSPATV